ncbi:MAG: HNH endonuclease [Taibaiella sp.]|nr:HNH endonuclease [Taibaiella sp.]
MATWKEDIISALNLIGGEGHYSDIYEAIEEIRGKENLPVSWKAIVRGSIETYSKDSEKFDGKNDLFYSVQGLGNGIWGLNNFEPDIHQVDLTEDDIEFPEGKKMLRKHILRERNPKLVRLAKLSFKQKFGKLFCVICDFDFTIKYGDIGNDFIEAHHIKPISEIKENEKTKIEDLIMVCSNCHRMLHRKRPWLNKEELKKLVENCL